MFHFLHDLLKSRNISLVLEEGGTCLNIAETLREHGNEKTIAQEVIANITDRTIAHSFVDITREEAEKLIERGIINDIMQLCVQRCELRNSYMAGASLRRLSDSRNIAALLLCADRHFIGVKRHLEEGGVPVVADSVERFGWYVSSSQVDSIHLNVHQEAEETG